MKKPWNIPSQPVYSLVTQFNQIHNYNICTYVISISMKPKLYAVAIYHNSKTLINAYQTDYAVLQMLSAEQFQLVRVLGKKTGTNYNKENYLSKKKLLEPWNNFQIIAGACSSILLKKISKQPTGDHDLFVYEAIQHKTVSDNYLSTGLLLNKKIIRA
jgi:flavin reductase (DIM6/NTAB) family NADH-FMN oxidoreductase RutF